MVKVFKAEVVSMIEMDQLQIILKLDADYYRIEMDDHQAALLRSVCEHYLVKRGKPLFPDPVESIKRIGPLTEVAGNASLNSREAE